MEVALDKFVKQKIEGINLLELKEEISEEIKNELIELWENKNEEDDGGGYKELKQLFVKHNGARYNLLILFPFKRRGAVVVYGEEKRMSPLLYIDNEELDNWIISTYYLIFGGKDFLNLEQRSTLANILIQVKYVDKNIKEKSNPTEWSAVRSMIMGSVDKMSSRNLSYNPAEANILLNMLGKLINLIKNIEIKFIEILNVLKEEFDSLSLLNNPNEVIPILNKKENKKFICELHRETINYLININDEFKDKIENLNSNEIDKLNWLYGNTKDKMILRTCRRNGDSVSNESEPHLKIIGHLISDEEIDKLLYLKAAFMYYDDIIIKFQKLKSKIYENFNDEMEKILSIKMVDDNKLIEIIDKKHKLIERMIKEKNPLKIVFPLWINQINEYIREVKIKLKIFN
uniref:Uncharacterized protein n=1 Tax=Meloidogyne enterolobii TaxID=390850 RepID=A0A6V7WIK8_MELEN|nr:unnamed protein product [Meloidogyne enterolobii]